MEKAFLLNEEFQKPEPRSLRMTRHLYDLERLMDTEFGKIALSDKELYGKIVEHRRKFYHVGYADYDKDYPGSIEFLPPERCLKEWEADYGEMLEHFVYGDRLSFTDVVFGYLVGYHLAGLILPVYQADDYFDHRVHLVRVAFCNHQCQRNERCI